MNSHLTTLYNLRLADERVQRANRQLLALDWGEAQHKAIGALRTQAGALAAKKTTAEKALRECERELATAADRIHRSERRIEGGSIHNVHEMESTERELEIVKTRRAALEETGLGLMEELEGVPAEAHVIHKKEQALLKEMEAIRQKSTAEKARLEGEIVDATKRAEDLTAQLPAEVLARYRRMRDQMGGLAVSRVVSGACGECRVAVSPADVRDILETTQLVACENCHRFLYTDAG